MIVHSYEWHEYEGLPGDKPHTGMYFPKEYTTTSWPRADCPQCGLSDWQFALDWYGGICFWCDSLMFVGMEDIPF